MKVGVNGAVRDISDFKAGVNGAVRAVSELWIGVNGAAKKVWPLIEVGYQEILDTVGSGEWTCPASGRWHLELHGGGGSGADRDFISTYGGGGGGGSGEEYEVTLNANEAISYFIGRCPGAYRDGQTTRFANYQCGGGLAADGIRGGSPMGTLATSGQPGGYNYSKGEGGLGNKNKPSQTYGNGGAGGGRNSQVSLGSPGAIILTYLG